MFTNHYDYVLSLPPQLEAVCLWIMSLSETILPKSPERPTPWFASRFPIGLGESTDYMLCTKTKEKKRRYAKWKHTIIFSCNMKASSVFLMSKIYQCLDLNLVGLLEEILNSLVGVKSLWTGQSCCRYKVCLSAGDESWWSSGCLSALWFHYCIINQSFSTRPKRWRSFSRFADVVELLFHNDWLQLTHSLLHPTQL